MNRDHKRVVPSCFSCDEKHHEENPVIEQCCGTLFHTPCFEKHYNNHLKGGM